MLSVSSEECPSPIVMDSIVVNEVNAKFCLDVALQLTQAVGKHIRNAFSSPSSDDIATKTNSVDLVTETDQKVEKMLISGLRNQFPSHKFIGEEAAAASGGRVEWTDAPTWIIDPIDGTTNFVNRLPHVGVSVALAVNRQVILGIVYNPILDELYSARKGFGAYKNGVPIKASNKIALKESVVATAVGNVREPTVLQNYFKNLEFLLTKNVRGLRSLGSAALHMAYVADGSLDAFVEYGIHCWDIAAGALIVTEAGGTCVDPTGNRLNLMKRRVLCTATKALALEMWSGLTHTDFESEG